MSSTHSDRLQFHNCFEIVIFKVTGSSMLSMSMVSFLLSTLSTLNHFWYNWKFLISCNFLFYFHIISLVSFIFRKLYVLIMFFICIIWCSDNLGLWWSRRACPSQGWVIPKDSKWLLCECAFHEPINPKPVPPTISLNWKQIFPYSNYTKSRYQTTKDNVTPQSLPKLFQLDIV